MTLGRALQDLGHTSDARAEFEYVLSLASDNLAAIRGLAELNGAEPDTATAPLLQPPALYEPDLAALDASIDPPDGASAADAERAAQVERLEIWLAKLGQARETIDDDA